MLRVIVYGKESPFNVINFDNDRDANTFIEESKEPHRELTPKEVKSMFGNHANWAGDQHTKQSGNTLESVVFSRQHPISDLEEAQQQALEKLRINVENITLHIYEKYSRKEIETWPIQEAEARGWKLWELGGKSEPEPPTPFIDSMISAAVVALDKEKLVNRIAYNAELYDNVIGKVIGQRVAKTDAIMEAKTVKAVNKVDIDIKLPYDVYVLFPGLDPSYCQ
jgi:hypothetical protein